MVKACHFYCAGCTGDSNTQCIDCYYGIYPNLMKSGNTCALSCQGGYGIDLLNP